MKKTDDSSITQNNRGGRRGGRSGPMNKPPPLMSRPLPPPMGMRRPPLLPSYGPMPPPPLPGLGPQMGPRGMRPPPPFITRRGSRGWGPPPRGRMMPPFSRGGGPPRGRGGLMPPPRPLLPRPPMYHPGGPPPLPFLPDEELMGPPLPFRGRGRGARFPPRGGFRGRGRGGFVVSKKTNVKSIKAKPKSTASPPGEFNKPWVTEAIKNEILKKHKLHVKAKRTNSKEDREIFREHRNKVTTMLREAKLKYISSNELNQEEANKILDEPPNQDSVNAEQEEAAESGEAIECNSPKLTENEESSEDLNNLKTDFAI